MSYAPTNNSHQQALDRHGKDVTHTTFSVDSTDSYGDNTYTSTSSTVTGRFEEVQTPQFTRDEAGEEVEVDALIVVKDSLTVTDVGDSRADEFTVDGTDYKVLTAEDQDNGLIRCRVRQIE